jgi:hypothetical protein
MSNIYQDLPSSAQLPTIWKGVVTQPPINFQARMHVSVPDMNQDLNFENIRWQARDNMSLPEAGDECLVLFDNNREPWVPVWWPADKRPSIYMSKHADGSPPNPVDGDIWFAEDKFSSAFWIQYIYNESSSAWEEVASLKANDVNNASLWVNAQPNGWGMYVESVDPNIVAYCVSLHSDARNRWEVETDGPMWWGDGVAVGDTSLERTAPRVLKTNGRIDGVDTAWQVPSISGNWGHYGEPYGPVRYRKLVTGLVVMEGLIIANNTSGGVAFYLPAGYRPSTQGMSGGSRILIFLTGNTSASISNETFRIQSDGAVVPTSVSAGQWLSFAGIQFYAG